MSQTSVLQPNERRILRLEEVEAKSGFKRAHIYNLMKKRQFPQACVWACAPWAGTPSKSISGSTSASTTGPDPFSRGLFILTRRTPCRSYPSFQPKVGSARLPPLRTSAVSLRTPDCACCCSTSMCSPPCPHTMSWLTARRAVSMNCWPSTSATSTSLCPARSSRAWTWCSPTTTEAN